MRTNFSVCALLAGCSLFLFSGDFKSVHAQDASGVRSDAESNDAEFTGWLLRNGPRFARRYRDHSAYSNSRIDETPDSTVSRNHFIPTAVPTASTRDNISATQPKTDEPRIAIQPDGEEIEITDESFEPKSELTPEMIELRDKLRKCLAHYYKRPEYAGGRSPWGIMHTLIAFGVDTQILVDNRKVNAIGWLCWNGPCRGQRLFYLSNGKPYPAQGPGVEGHSGQFLSMLAQSRVKREYPIKVGGRDFTIEDLIEHEKRTCRAGSELTFKLIGLSHYLDSDATWKSEYGQDWSISRLIKEELSQSVIGAACGGTHRMMGFSYAVNRRVKQGKEVTGQWLRAKKFTESYHDYTFRLQNPDGSFSTNWFEGRGNWGDAATRVRTTGHILEWMVYSLPEDQLTDPRVVKAVSFLTNLMLTNRNTSWEIGPRGHALHALVLYDQRVFGAKPGGSSAEIAKSSTQPEPE